ncbi:MAG TPA: sugar phosphate nucleotidyltransferase [Thermoanaerobaculia bacterium]|jgi:mannose-1-phosphate guanylyltransferase
MTSGFPFTGRLWSVVLAGGEGIRLRPLVERIHADGRPKQYAVLVGSRSLLRQTLDRSKLIVPAERTVVVTTRAHKPFFSAELGGPGPPAPSMIVQPRDRGTAAGVLLPVHWIARQDPQALVAVFPSDHFIGDDQAFARHVADLAAVAARHPECLHLLGARPDGPETGYGWIEPGDEVDRAPSGGLRRVVRFWEKPSPETARACLERGGLWNTFVMVARAATLIEAGRRALPELSERLSRIAPLVGSDPEAPILESAYLRAPSANFSADVLAALPSMLTVSRMPPIAWSDWGTPDRVIATLQREGIRPSWLQELATTA